MGKNTKYAKRVSHNGLFYLVPAATILLTLTACASTPMAPDIALHAAEQEIKAAEQARITSPELTEAREKLTAARSAVEAKKMVVARRLAEQSRVDAELASANHDTAKEKAVNDEIITSIKILKQEMQRNTGEGQ